MLPLPSMGVGRKPADYLFYTLKVLASWLRIAAAIASLRNQCSLMHISLGQTWASMIRDSVPLILSRFLLGGDRLIISLHGSNFMGWGARSFKNKAFLCLLRIAWRVTVLGDRQRGRLLMFGFDETKVRVMINTCDLDSLDLANSSSRKISMDSGSLAMATRQPVRVLYLSSLIDTKGFPTYLEALLELSRSRALATVNIDAVLCGTFVGSEFATRFTTAEEATVWITAMLAEINQSQSVKVHWVRGARGAAKLNLFHEADVFVLPTQYAVEAQPLVLLEAMATGCAIVTSRIGEIESILSNDTAILLDTVDLGNVARAICSLATDHVMRRSVARRAWQRYHENYDFSRHIDNWVMLLTDGEQNKSAAEAI